MFCSKNLTICFQFFFKNEKASDIIKKEKRTKMNNQKQVLVFFKSEVLDLKFRVFFFKWSVTAFCAPHCLFFMKKQQTFFHFFYSKILHENVFLLLSKIMSFQAYCYQSTFSFFFGEKKKFSKSFSLILLIN